MTQADALNILKTGVNVFLTGPAGSGKTYVLREYLKILRDRDISVGVTASTGIAATHMGGMTIHSWSGIGIHDSLSETEIEEIAKKGFVRTKIESAKILIIDEISMLHHFRLDLINEVIKKIRKSDAPFGGLQLVVCGDFFQLPPVSRGGEPDAYFAYHSPSWKEAKFTVCYLEEQHRQIDKEYVGILNGIRDQVVTKEMKDLLLGRLEKPEPFGVHGLVDGDDGVEFIEDTNNYDEQTIFIGEESNILVDSKTNKQGQEVKSKNIVEKSNVVDSMGDSLVDLEVKIKPTRLYSHNRDVDTENDRELNAISGEFIEYKMTSFGNKKLVEGLKKSCLAPEILRLKKGAQVMFVKNNWEEGYANGTRGTVVECIYDGIIVKTLDGREIEVPKESWHIDEGDRTLAEIEQYPLRLAWAITIHKSQGMSLDSAQIDLSRSFENGMGYVALSRVRSLLGLKLIGLNKLALDVHPEALEFDKYFRELSKNAEVGLMALSVDELKILQRKFIGPDPVIREPGESDESYDARVRTSKREKKISKTVKKVKIPTIMITKELIDKRKSVLEVAKERDLTFETILHHIEQIKAEDPNWSISHLRSSLPITRFKKISMAFHAVGVQEGGKRPLSPVKQILGTNFTFDEIRFVRLFL